MRNFMKLVHNKQIWKGTFTYKDGYEEAYQYITVDFQMDLIFTNDSFVGTSIDSESQHIFDKPAEVLGFIDDEKISFILNYPCYYYRDENGLIVLDKDFNHPEIHYLGFWEEDKKNVSGIWEMKIYEEEIVDGYLEALATGEFEMQRMN